MLPLLADLKDAFRSLRKSPGLTVAGVLSLALGIGANVTIYSIVREMVLDDISARQPDRLVGVAANVSYSRYREMQDAGVFQDLAFSLRLTDVNWISGAHGEVAWQKATSANFFDVLGVGASVGRLYSQNDEGHPVAVVSYGFWRRRLRGDAGVVGRTLNINGHLYTVTGVLPRDYRSVMRRGITPEVYTIASPNSADCGPFGRLRDGRTRNQTREALFRAARNMGGRGFRASCRRPTARRGSGRERCTRRRRSPFLYIFRNALWHCDDTGANRLPKCGRLATGARPYPAARIGNSQSARRQPPPYRSPAPGRRHSSGGAGAWSDRVAGIVKQVPGVTGVTSIGTLPLMGELPSQDFVRRRSDSLPAARQAYELGGGEQFCRVLGISILRGRDFEIADRTRRPVPTILDETLARRLFGRSDPLGEEITVGSQAPRLLVVVGVAADAKLRTLGEDHPPVFLTPFSFAQFLVATAGNGAQWVRPLQNALAHIDSEAAVEVRPLTDAAAGALFPMRIAATFAGSLAGIGLLLVVTGLYSSVSHATRRRAREMAIRAAIGADRVRISGRRSVMVLRSSPAGSWLAFPSR